MDHAEHVERVEIDRFDGERPQVVLARVGQLPRTLQGEGLLLKGAHGRRWWRSRVANGFAVGATTPLETPAAAAGARAVSVDHGR